MKKITIEIKTENAAFDDGNNGNTEAARILRDYADKLENGRGQAPWSNCLNLHDANGNTIGSVEITD